MVHPKIQQSGLSWAETRSWEHKFSPMLVAEIKWFALSLRLTTVCLRRRLDLEVELALKLSNTIWDIHDSWGVLTADRHAYSLLEWFLLKWRCWLLLVTFWVDVVFNWNRMGNSLGHWVAKSLGQNTYFECEILWSNRNKTPIYPIPFSYVPESCDIILAILQSSVFKLKWIFVSIKRFQDTTEETQLKWVC